MILDSTFLVDVLRGTSDVSDLIEEIDASGSPFVSTVTVMELYEGVRLTDATEAERSAVDELLSEIDALPFEKEAAKRAGSINADLITAGNPIDETDVMIAATALANDYPVVTRNVDHFQRVDDLEVVTY